MKRLSQREITLLAISFVVGLVIGMVLIGSSDDLRDSLFGTASDKKADEPVYYRVNLDAARQWLDEQFEADVIDPDTLEKDVDLIARLANEPDFQTQFTNAEVYAEAEAAVNTLLPQMYGALTGADDLAEPKLVDDDTATCLVYDENVYFPALYVRVTLSPDQAKDFEVPDAWELLGKPKKTMLQQEVACYPPTAGES